MSSPRSEFLRRRLLPATLLALAPKCALCLLAYAGAGAILGLGGPELCGAAESPARLPWLPGALGAAAFLAHLLMNARSLIRR